MQYFSSGVALSLCGLRFRVRVELDDDPEDLDYVTIGHPVCEHRSAEHIPPRSA
jgi:hypothetical protein